MSGAGESAGEGDADPRTEATAYSSSPAGASAWLEPKDPERLISQRKLVVLLPTGQQKVCDAEECEGLTDLWWSENGRNLFGLQFTGWARSEEHTSELQSLMRISYAVLCLKKKKYTKTN